MTCHYARPRDEVEFKSWEKLTRCDQALAVKQKRLRFAVQKTALLASVVAHACHNCHALSKTSGLAYCHHGPDVPGFGLRYLRISVSCSHL